MVTGVMDDGLMGQEDCRAAAVTVAERLREVRAVAVGFAREIVDPGQIEARKGERRS